MKPIKYNTVHSKYELYLMSEEFDKIRQAVFKRDNYMCVVCGCKENIQPHHLTYRNIYHEELNDLITVCRQCHVAYHEIANRTNLLEEIYSNKVQNTIIDNQKLQEEYERKQAECRKKTAQIIQEIKNEFLPQDYCSGGNLNMCDSTVLTPIIERKCSKANIGPHWINHNYLKSWFRYRRLEFFKKCLDANMSIDDVQAKTTFMRAYLLKWYKRSIVEAKLNEEKEINKED